MATVIVFNQNWTIFGNCFLDFFYCNFRAERSIHIRNCTYHNKHSKYTNSR